MTTPTTTQGAKSEPTPVELKLPHCGEILVNKDQILGWFNPIPLPLWDQIVGFHYGISQKHNAESVSYHRFNPNTGLYDTIIPFQKTAVAGLAVKADWTDERNVALLDDYARDHGQEFFPACTIHTHVDAAAFESGTDAGDEEDQPGWHITIGHLLSHKELDLDFRFRLPKIPGVKSLTSATISYDLDWEHLFHEDVKEDEVTQPNHLNDDWEHLQERVDTY